MMDHHQILRPDASSNPSGKSACDREQLHNLLHLLSAAGLLWFALQSWHATHPLGLIHALTARRSDAPSLARAAQPAPERSRRENCHCSASAQQLSAHTQQPSANASCESPAGQVKASITAPQPAASILEAAEKSGAAQPRVVMFYHVAAMNNWREVVSDQLSKVVFSGLYVHMHAAFVTCCGQEQEDADACADLVTSFGTKFVVMSRCLVRHKQFERATLGQIKNRTLDGDLVLYIHSKGVSEKNQGPVRQQAIYQWRLYMEYFLIRHHQRCRELLSTCDAVGLDYTSYNNKTRHQHMQHFSGNFWWTTAAYYRTLPDDIADYYLAPENHLLQKAQQIAVLWTSGFKGKKHYSMTYPMARYVDADADSFQQSLQVIRPHTAKGKRHPKR